MNKPKIAIVRGKFLNKYEMQIFEPLVSEFNITAFGSLYSYHDKFTFPIIKLPSPMDLGDFLYKMPILNRCFIDAHYLFGLENKLKGFDLVHSAETYYHYTQQCLNARKKGYVKKVIATVLENIPFNNEGIWGRKGFKKKAREELDHIIALTNRTKETLVLEGTDPKKITVIGHGINTEVFCPDHKSLASRSPRFGEAGRSGQITNHKPLTILFAGRLEVYKGVYEVIYAVKKLLSDRDLKSYSIKLTMVGEGREKEKLVSLTKKLNISDKVIFKLVSYEEMPKEYQKADIFTAPSKSSKFWQEQYCTTLLEAQSSGLPMVTTLSGGIPENVLDAAILVQPGDFLSLYQALKNFILNPKLRFEYAKKARTRALKFHDARIKAKQVSDLYRLLLEG